MRIWLASPSCRGTELKEPNAFLLCSPQGKPPSLTTLFGFCSCSQQSTSLCLATAWYLHTLIGGIKDKGGRTACKGRKERGKLLQSKFSAQWGDFGPDSSLPLTLDKARFRTPNWYYSWPALYLNVKRNASISKPSKKI